VLHYVIERLENSYMPIDW